MLGNSSSRAKLEKMSLAKVGQFWASLGSTGLSGVHRTVSGAQLVSGRRSHSRVIAGAPWLKITGLPDVHRTVRCARPPTALSRANGRRGIGGRPRQLGQRSPGRTGLSGVPNDRGDQRSAPPQKEGDRALWSVRCAPDCPVHPQTEGNQGLPNEGATTP